MGSLLVEIGQCGCQIGSEVNLNLSTVSNSYVKRPNSNVLHTIMLDTQPKIIKPFIQNRVKYSYLDPKNLKYFQYGRANNWSYGYLDSKTYQPFPEVKREFEFTKVFSKQKPLFSSEKYFKENTQIIEFTMDAIRKELEKTTSFLGLNVICSLGGGTGSGLGTRIIQEVRNNFKTRIICHAVLPNQSGETPLQHYNCALSIASIHQNANAVFTYENDKSTSLFCKDSEQVDLKSINKYLGSVISSILKLNDTPDYNRYYFDLIDQCVLSPELNFLQAFSSYDIPKDGNEWENVMNSIYWQIQNSNRDEYWTGSERKERTFHSQIVFKGKEEVSLQKQSLKRLNTLLNPISQMSVSKTGRKQTEKQCLIIANRSRISRYLGHLIDKGQKKLKIGAYTWNYLVDIQPAFDSLHSIVQSYSCN